MAKDIMKVRMVVMIICNAQPCCETKSQFHTILRITKIWMR